MDYVQYFPSLKLSKFTKKMCAFLNSFDFTSLNSIFVQFSERKIPQTSLNFMYGTSPKFLIAKNYSPIIDTQNIPLLYVRGPTKKNRMTQKSLLKSVCDIVFELIEIEKINLDSICCHSLLNSEPLP